MTISITDRPGCYTRAMESSAIDPSKAASDLPAARATFTRLLGHPISMDALFSGIPVPQEGPSLEMAYRAAQRAG
ncbi:MAG: hypothetical protein L7T26_06290, partial [Pseudomonadales bacterium]|nr:hypothetical protein [Pseudomonadales bacterium]